MNTDIQNIEDYSEAGFTIIELVVSLVLSSVILSAGLFQYLNAAKQAHDNQIRAATFLQAQAVIQNMGFEIRTLGNGVPFDQAYFQIGDGILSDPTVTEPVLISGTSADKISFRLNETGDVFLLTQDFNPSSSTTIHLTSVDNLQSGDPIYISNSVVGGDEGLYGEIHSVNSGNKTINLTNFSVTSPGSLFDKGSILEEVPLVVYENNTTLNSITRNSGYGEVVVAENATLGFRYLDYNGAEISYPLTNWKVVDKLRSIELAVEIESDKKLSTGVTYKANVKQVFGLRNLNYLF